MGSLRKIIRETLNRHLKESMDMGISNFKYEDELEGVLDICHYVVKKVAYDLYPKLGLTAEEKEQIGGIGDDFTPDGDDAFELVGTMNFYAAKYPERTIDKIVSYIKYILAEKNITIGDIRKETTGQKLNPEELKDWGLTGKELRVIRIPIIKNESGDSGNPPSINISNNNAHDLFGKLLGIPNEGGHYNMNSADLIMTIKKTRKELEHNNAIPDKSYSEQKGNFISPVHGKDYYNEMLNKIEGFAKWALNRGYSSLYVA